MKSILSLVAACVLCPASALSQTELWRLSRPNDSFAIAAQDSLGNTYVSIRAGVGPSDSLLKVGPEGSVLWQVPIPGHNTTILLTADGLYLAPPLYINGPVYRYDLNGNLQWSFSLPDGATSTRFPALSADGAIVLAYSVSPPPVGSVAFPPLYATLVKLNPLGTRVFEVAIPIIAPNAYQQYILGPAIAQDGNIWIVAQARSESERFLGSSQAYRGLGFDEAMLFNGQTGQLMTRKNLFRGITDDWQDNANGSSHTYVLNTASSGGPAQFITTSGTTLVVGGYWDTQTTKCKANGECYFLSKSEWRMALVTPAGKVTNFRYRGGGEVRRVDGQTIVRSDESGNELLEIMPGPNNDLYLHGTVARGRSANGTNDFAYHDALMRYNLATKRPAWTVMSAAVSSSISTVLHSSSDVILRRRDEYSLDMYDLSGGLGSTLLRFSDPVYLTGTQYHGMNYIAFTEPGTIILRGTNTRFDVGQQFLAKYSIASALASQRYAPAATTAELNMPESYALQQNYPNPFNPSTTIEFELPVDASVTVNVYNSLGQVVAALADREEFAAGANQLEFDAGSLPSGVYYYRMTAAGLGDGGRQFSAMKKMIFLK
jgi:hypothetical protein